MIHQLHKKFYIVQLKKLVGNENITPLLVGNGNGPNNLREFVLERACEHYVEQLEYVRCMGGQNNHIYSVNIQKFDG